MNRVAREFHFDVVNRVLLAGDRHVLAGPPELVGAAYGIYADYWRKRRRVLLARARGGGLELWLEAPRRIRRHRSCAGADPAD